MKQTEKTKPDIDQIIASGRDVTVHVYDLPEGTNHKKVRVYITEPDTDLKLSDQEYGIYAGTEDDTVVEHLYNESVIDRDTGAMQTLRDIEHKVLSHFYDEMADCDLLVIEERSDRLYSRHYLQSDEYIEALCSMIATSKGREVLIAKDKNLLEYEPYGMVTAVNPGVGLEVGAVQIHTVDGRNALAYLPDFFDLINEHVMVFAAEVSDDMPDQSHLS